MDNLIFSLNATLPIFLTMLLGLFFRHIGLMDDKFTGALNKFVFKIALPLLLFQDLAGQDFRKDFDFKFVGFCFLVTLLSIFLMFLLSKIVISKDRGKQGEFIQVSYRSSAAILGIAFIQNIYGDGNSGMAPLMILGSVPLYNIFAVIVLTLSAPGLTSSASASPSKLDHALIKKTLRGILTNPIILGIVIGMVWSLLGINPFFASLCSRIGSPEITLFSKTIDNVAKLATPLGLMAMGASFDLSKAKAEVVPSLIASFCKLIGLTALFLPLAIFLGFRNQEMVAILVMLGSASTVSCYIMAKNMGHEGTLTSSTVMMTTFGCAFTLTFWLWFIRTLGLI